MRETGAKVPEPRDSDPAGAAALPSLEEGTELYDRATEYWTGTVYQGSVEGSVVREPSVPGLHRRRPGGGRGELSELERAALNEERAGRRARASIRRFAVANTLCVMWTLTFTDAHLPDDRRAAFNEGWRFVRRLRDHLGTEFAYVTVYERGARHGRPHLHMLLPGWVQDAITSHEVRLALWGRGWVKYSDFRKRSRASSLRDRCRAAAGYVAKYAGKDLTAERGPGSQRYRVAQGFQVRVVRRTGVTLTEALRFAASDIRAMGLVPVVVGCGHARDGPPAALVVARSH